MMRKLIDVIDEMLSVIPKQEESLISFFEDVKDSQRVRAPEDTIGWWQISDKLDSILDNIESTPKILRKIKVPLWELKLFSIFTKQPLEELKREIYG
jgi:hypothetical protein